jgi:ketosteroid isomerase-like protein
VEESIERTVRGLMDREEIKELTARYCWHVMRGEGAKIVELFADDAVFDNSANGGAVANGRAELLKFYEGIRPLQAIPFIQNHIIEVNGDAANGTCAIEGRFTVKGDSLTGAGYYEDRYRRVNGQWRFAARKLFLHHMVPLKEGWASAHQAKKSI